MAEPIAVDAWECSLCGELYHDVDRASDCCMETYRRLNVEVVG